MATAHDATAFGQFKGVGIKYPYGQGRCGIVHLHLNMATIVAELGVAINPSSPDTLDVWDVPVGTQIHGCLLHIRTAFTTTATAATCTCSVGDSGSTAGYIATSADCKTVAYTGTIVTDTFGAATKVYAATLPIRITFAGTATVILTGIMDLYFNCDFFDIATAEPSSWV